MAQPVNVVVDLSHHNPGVDFKKLKQPKKLWGMA